MEGMIEKTTLEVIIAGRHYPLKIQKKDEEMVLRIVKNINMKLEQLRQAYDAKDNQDYLAMCLLQLTAQQVSQSDSSSFDFEPQINEIEAILADI
jgi:cell division protein ZapA